MSDETIWTKARESVDELYDQSRREYTERRMSDLKRALSTLLYWHDRGGIDESCWDAARTEITGEGVTTAPSGPIPPADPSPLSRIARLRIALQEVVDRSAVLHSLVYSPEVWTPDDDPSSDLGSGERAVNRLHASLNRARAELAASYAENVKTDAAAQEKELDRG